MNTELGAKMLEAAEAASLPSDDPLRTRAEEFNTAAGDFFAEPPKATLFEFVRAWTRARREWCAHSGDPLV